MDDPVANEAPDRRSQLRSVARGWVAKYISDPFFGEVNWLAIHDDYGVKVDTPAIKSLVKGRVLGIFNTLSHLVRLVSDSEDLADDVITVPSLQGGLEAVEHEVTEVVAKVKAAIKVMHTHRVPGLSAELEAELLQADQDAQEIRVRALRVADAFSTVAAVCKKLAKAAADVAAATPSFARAVKRAGKEGTVSAILAGGDVASDKIKIPAEKLLAGLSCKAREECVKLYVEHIRRFRTFEACSAEPVVLGNIRLSGFKRANYFPTSGSKDRATKFWEAQSPRSAVKYTCSYLEKFKSWEQQHYSEVGYQSQSETMESAESSSGSSSATESSSPRL